MSENNDRIPVFNYGDLNEDHKKAAAEIASIIENSGNGMLADLIRSKFQVVEIPKYDLETSLFFQEAQKAGIFCAVQGFVQEGIDQNAKQYQLISICEDVRKLDRFIESLKSSV